MNTKEIELLICDFEEMSVVVKNYLSQAIGVISEGKILSEQLETELNNSLSELKNQYKFIKERVSELVDASVIPEEIIAAKNFTDIIKENERIKYERELTKAREVLLTFLRVKSAISGYANALKPIQDQISETLTYHDNGLISDEEFTSAATVPGMFIEAISLDDIDSERGMDLTDQIGEVYPKRVMAGVVACKYYISDEDERESLDKTQGKADVEQKDSRPESEAIIEVQEENKNEQVELVQDEVEKFEENDSSVVIAVDDVVIEANNNPKSNTPNAKSFKNECKGYPNAIGVIFPLFTNFGLLTEQQIYKLGVCFDVIDEENEAAKENLSPLLSRLASKGWLAEYKLDENTTAYSLCKFVFGTLGKESVRNNKAEFKWAFSFGTYDFKTEKSMSKRKLINAYRSNEAIIRYLYSLQKNTENASFNKVVQSIKWNEDHYEILVMDENEFVNTALLYAEEDILRTSEENVLWVSDNITQELKVDDLVKRVYVWIGNGVKAFKPENGIVLISYEEEAKAEITAIEEIDNAEEIQKVEEESSVSEEVIDEVESLDDEMSSLSDVHRAMNDTELYSYAIELATKGRSTTESMVSNAANAILLMKAASMEAENIKCKELYNQFLYAMAYPLDDKNYTYTVMSELFQFDSPDVLLLAAQMQAMLVPGMAYDHALHGCGERFLSDFDTIFPEFGFAKELFNKLTRIWKVAPNGYTSSILALLGNDSENQIFMKDVQSKAKNLLSVPSVKTRMTTLPVLYSLSFGPNSDLYACMSIISENDTRELELVKGVLEDFCDVVDGQYNLNAVKTEAILDKKWSEANPGNNFTLEYDARPQALKHYYNRINLMKIWVEHTESLGGKNIDISKLKTLREEIVLATDKALEGILATDAEYKNILYTALLGIKNYLLGDGFVSPYKSVLYTGKLSLNEQLIPILDESMAGIKYCEPWRWVIRHIEFEPLTQEAVIEAINDKDSLLFDNLNQLELLGKNLGLSSEEFIVGEVRHKKAVTAADTRTTKFRERLELAYTYDQITENDKESIAAIMEQQQERFYSIMDFGCWRQFLDGLERQIVESAIKGRRELQEKIKDRLEQNPNSSILLEADRLLKRDANLAVTEEYLNRYDAGEKEISIEMETYLTPRNDFSNFLSDDVYGPLLEFWKQKSTTGALKNIGWNFISGRLPADWTSRLRDDSKKLIESWPAGRNRISESQIKNLFLGLGFPVEEATIVKGVREDTFQLVLTPTTRSMADYPHPISAFGTQMKRNMNVIILFGNHTPSQIVETVTRADSKGFSIVLIDRALEKVTRRQIGELSHQKSGQNPFILVDWVLLMHLAMQDNTKRLPMLLSCTLPYTIYQPFVHDAGPTADEMFCGRTKELNSIIDPNGASVVYGGRQLGKTALLERAESRCHRPENREFAVYCSIWRTEKEEKVAELIVNEINKKTELGLKTCKTIKDVCGQLDTLFRKGIIASFLLLLDECDAFLGAIAENSYQQINDMIILKRSTTNAFKFVLAGLHNVCRAKNSTERNGVFGQLGEPLCVRPLQPTEALQLLSRPLSYLGFQIDPYPHLKTILTKTNYYPGILQFFGYKLLETLTDQYSKYYSASNGNPPFTLKDEQLGAVLSSAALNDSIKMKFRWSLELDQRYFMIARCITMLYYFEQEEQKGNWKGFTIQQIMDMANGYEIHCLEKMSHVDYKNLLDEMVDMGILSRTEQDAYRLRRSSFIGIIGADIDALDKDIIDNNQEVTA